MTTAALLDIVANALLLSGAAFGLAAGIGLLRFPDVLSRMHAATKPQVLGLLLILAGVGIRLFGTVDSWMLLLVGAFQLVTAPVAAHLVGRASYRTRHVRRGAHLLLVDELRRDIEAGTASARTGEGQADADPA